MKQMLILGAGGMLGSMLCDVFADYSPMCWDQADVDITDLDALRERVHAQNPDLIINAAAYTDVDESEQQREQAFAINETGVRNIATVARDMDATVVHYSTDYVFPGTKPEGYREDDPPGPAVNAYGESKLAGERALAEVHPTYYLLRTAWLYGPGGGNFVETMLSLGDKHDRLTVIDDQRGSPTYTKDVAGATRTIVEDDQYEPGIYHTVNAGTASWFEFAQRIFALSDYTMDIKPVTTDEFPLPAARPAYSVLQNTKGPEMREWQSALADYMQTRQ